VGHVDISLWFAFGASTTDRLRPDDGEFAGARWFPFAEIAHGPGTRFDPHLPRFVAALIGALDG
jgi:8-oxo-dGTP diphosphatase